MRFILVSFILVTSLLRANEIKELSYLSNVKNVIISTQKIRGGTYNFLNGSEFAQFGVYEERSLQKNYFKNLDRAYSIGGKRADSAFDKLRKQTKSLNKVSFQLEPIDSFRAYSTLINKMIITNKEISKNFFKKADPSVKVSMSIMVDDLIPLSEGLGKLRGLGSGIVARSYCEDEEVDMMYDYLSEIQKNLSSVVKQTKRMHKEHPKQFTKNTLAKVKILEKEIKEYKLFAKLKMINKKDIRENSNEYFDRGTALITKVMELYRINEEIIKSNFEMTELAYFN